MSLLLIAEAAPGLAIPEFGGAFAGHMAGKHNPAARAASLAAWRLLACGLRELGCAALPSVAFGPQGKPRFTDSNLHFSLAHSGALAAALISEAPCGVDLERIRPEVAHRLAARCLSDGERARQIDFFECWTKKECIGKLDGRGITAHPSDIDTLDPHHANRFFTARIHDASGQEYALSALCEGADALSPRRISPEALARAGR